MTMQGSDVVDVVTMQLVLSDATVLPVTTELSFLASDPYTIRATFSGQSAMSTWLFGRELLQDGLSADEDQPAGLGDVRIWRDEDPEYVLIALYGIEGEALLACPVEPLERFLATTATLVPLGHEGDSMELQIAALIAELSS
ncbi:MAG: SsgA family sporulation/cell division regulator [Actinomycetota bacterium]|nr:SsgA family sporulation/cell division regulator [Actinomycetota bacterium]